LDAAEEDIEREKTSMEREGGIIFVEVCRGRRARCLERYPLIVCGQRILAEPRGGFVLELVIVKPLQGLVCSHGPQREPQRLECEHANIDGCLRAKSGNVAWICKRLRKTNRVPQAIRYSKWKRQMSGKCVKARPFNLRGEIVGRMPHRSDDDEI
jgi:hypothetical protein